MPANLAAHTYQAVIFDHDGTLVDSEATHCDCWNRVLKTFGAELAFDDYLTNYNGLPTIDTATRLKHQFNLNDSPEALHEAKIKALKDFLAREAFPLLPHVLTVLQRLRAQGVPMAIASGANRYEVEHSVEHHQLSAFFSAIVAKQDVTRSKPHPETYLKAATALNLPVSACIAIEDSDTGQQSAEAAGMFCLRLSPSGEPSTHRHMNSVLGELETIVAGLTTRS